jgi:hypothetical protein
MELSEQPLAVKMLYNSGFMLPSVVVHEHWPVSQRMIVEIGDYAWSKHIATVYLEARIVQHFYSKRLFRQFHGLRCRQI